MSIYFRRTEMEICGDSSGYYRDMWHFGKIKGKCFSSSTANDIPKPEAALGEMISVSEKTTIDAQETT